MCWLPQSQAAETASVGEGGDCGRSSQRMPSSEPWSLALRWQADASGAPEAALAAALPEAPASPSDGRGDDGVEAVLDDPGGKELGRRHRARAHVGFIGWSHAPELAGPPAVRSRIRPGA